MALKFNILILICSINFCLQGQKVSNKYYQILLNKILSNDVREVTVEEALKMDSVVFLDAREINEYRVSHIKNANWIGYKTFSNESLNETWKQSKLIVYCSVGKRSEDIVRRLNELGYLNVFNLIGGIFEWKNQEGLVYDQNENETNRVHGFSKIWSIWLNKGQIVLSN